MLPFHGLPHSFPDLLKRLTAIRRSSSKSVQKHVSRATREVPGPSVTRVNNDGVLYCHCQELSLAIEDGVLDQELERRAELLTPDPTRRPVLDVEVVVLVNPVPRHLVAR